MESCRHGSSGKATAEAAAINADKENLDPNMWIKSFLFSYRECCNLHKPVGPSVTYPCLGGMFSGCLHKERVPQNRKSKDYWRWIFGYKAVAECCTVYLDTWLKRGKRVSKAENVADIRITIPPIELICHKHVCNLEASVHHGLAIAIVILFIMQLIWYTRAEWLVKSA